MFMHSIKLENILSFGPDTQELELEPLNVLIGPNGSGKSNLIEVFSLLRAAPSDFMAPIREGGGGENWTWRGEPTATEARVEVVLSGLFFPSEEQLVCYSVAFDPTHFHVPRIMEETIEDKSSKHTEGNVERYLKRSGRTVLLNHLAEGGGRRQRELPASEFAFNQSILSQLKDPFQYPELRSVEVGFEGIRLYREWSFGRNTPPRLPQKADLPNRYLEEDGKNLGMVLSRLRRDPNAKNKLLTALKRLYHDVQDFDVHVEAGSVQVFLQEGRVTTIPAVRLSDGTLRYLCLLAILCNPSLPSLVCLEEPELGLHPDVLPGLADLLREASERCQLVVTTHSDTLVDALTDTPESIVICEKESGQTRLKRLDKNELAHWLEKYRLGELWTSGELGGTRW